MGSHTIYDCQFDWNRFHDSKGNFFRRI